MTEEMSEKDSYFRAMTEALERARTNEQVCNVMLIIVKQRKNEETGQIELNRSLRHNYEDVMELIGDLSAVASNANTVGLSNAPEGEF